MTPLRDIIISNRAFHQLVKIYEFEAFFVENKSNEYMKVDSFLF